jgi:hypothetical protein
MDGINPFTCEYLALLVAALHHSPYPSFSSHQLPVYHRQQLWMANLLRPGSSRLELTHAASCPSPPPGPQSTANNARVFSTRHNPGHRSLALLSSSRRGSAPLAPTHTLPHRQATVPHFQLERCHQSTTARQSFVRCKRRTDV